MTTKLLGAMCVATVLLAGPAFASYDEDYDDLSGNPSGNGTGGGLAATTALAGSFDENDDVSNGGSWASDHNARGSSTPGQRSSLKTLMTRHQWGSLHPNKYLDEFVNTRSYNSANKLLDYFNSSGVHHDNSAFGGTAGGKIPTHSGCGSGCLDPSHPRSQ